MKMVKTRQLPDGAIINLLRGIKNIFSLKMFLYIQDVFRSTGLDVVEMTTTLSPCPPVRGSAPPPTAPSSPSTTGPRCSSTGTRRRPGYLWLSGPILLLLFSGCRMAGIFLSLTNRFVTNNLTQFFNILI